jgi:hypothetical protein
LRIHSALRKRVTILCKSRKFDSGLKVVAGKTQLNIAIACRNFRFRPGEVKIYVSICCSSRRDDKGDGSGKVSSLGDIFGVSEVALGPDGG